MAATPWTFTKQFFSSLASGWSSDGEREYIERPDRFRARIPLAYRPLGKPRWFRGVIENVNLEGVLFRCTKRLPEGCPIEVNFWLSAEEGSASKAHVFFRARVTRVEAVSHSSRRVALAARVLQYRESASAPPDLRQIIGEVRGPVAGEKIACKPRWQSFEWDRSNPFPQPAAALPGCHETAQNPFSRASLRSTFAASPASPAAKEPCLWLAEGCVPGTGDCSGSEAVSCPLAYYMGLCPGCRRYGYQSN